MSRLQDQDPVTIINAEMDDQIPISSLLLSLILVILMVLAI